MRGWIRAVIGILLALGWIVLAANAMAQQGDAEQGHNPQPHPPTPVTHAGIPTTLTLETGTNRTQGGTVIRTLQVWSGHRWAGGVFCEEGNGTLQLSNYYSRSALEQTVVTFGSRADCERVRAAFAAPLGQPEGNGFRARPPVRLTIDPASLRVTGVTGGDGHEEARESGETSVPSGGRTTPPARKKTTEPHGDAEILDPAE